MAQLPEIKRLHRQDFPDQTSWIDGLLAPLNRFFDSVYTALNRGLTFRDNMVAQVKELEFRETSGTYPIRFAWNLKSQPTDLIVTRVVTVSGSGPSGAVWANWSYNGSAVEIEDITGLTADDEYKIRVIAFAG